MAISRRILGVNLDLAGAVPWRFGKAGTGHSHLTQPLPRHAQGAAEKKKPG